MTNTQKTRVNEDFLLDRQTAVPAVIGEPSDFLIISGLSGAARDIGYLTKEAPNTYLLGGAMGAAASMGLGLALAQPDKRVLIVSGDGEFLMNVSSLATIGHMRPSNLSMLCIDNGRYGETGNQESHTYRNADLAAIAHASGINTTLTVKSEDQLEQAARVLRNESGPIFVVLRVNDGAPSDYARNFDAVETKANFRRALLSGC